MQLKLTAGSTSKYTFSTDLTGAPNYPEPFLFTVDNGRLEFVNQVPCVLTGHRTQRYSAGTSFDRP